MIDELISKGKRVQLIINVKENVEPKKIASVFKKGKEVNEVIFKIYGNPGEENGDFNEILTSFFKHIDISKFVYLDFLNF